MNQSRTYTKGAKFGKKLKGAVELDRSGIIRPVNSIEYSMFFDAPDDQEQEGSCTAHGTAATGEMFDYKRTGRKQEFSRQAIYTQSKVDNLSGAEDMQDDGAFVSDALSVLKTHGYVLESDWPYDQDHLLKPVPPELWHTDFKIKNFVEVPSDISGMQLALLKHGPIVVGLNWAYEWEDGVPQNGMLSPNPQNVAGGHCVVITGFSDTKQAFRIRNSWGTSWANNGYCWMPFSVQRNAPEFWFTDLYTLEV